MDRLLVAVGPELYTPEDATVPSEHRLSVFRLDAGA
jgi:hypothetical protein